MGFSLTNIYRSTYLRYGLPTIIYFIPALYFQYVSEVDTKDCRTLLPPVFVYVFTYFHQLLLNSPVTPFRFPYAIDLLLTVLEMAAYITMWRLSYSSDPAFLSLAVFDLIIFCVLFLIGSLKLADVITHSSSESVSRRGVWDFSAKYDYLTARPWSKDDSKRAKKKLTAGDLTGNLTFLFSRFMVVLFVYFTIGFAWNTIIIEPIRETASIPLRASKSLHHPSQKLKTGTSDVWNVIVGRPTFVGSDLKSDSLSLASAVEVVLLSTNGDSSLRTPCPLTSWQSAGLPQKDLFTNTPMTLNAIAFNCPYKADILVTVNFTKLGDLPDEGITSVVQVMLGSVNDNPTEVIRRTEVPALLIPGFNFVGFAKMHILQKFKRPKLSTLGLFDSYETFLVSEIVNLSPDPQAPASSAPDPRMAMMRIIPLIDLADWRIIQEYRDRSVLKGFSIVGGLWTFLGGVFAFLFGKSISLIVFNIKPLSIFGIVDQFQKDSIGVHYRKKYDGIENDVEKGYNKFMADHFVALDLITATTSTSSSNQTLAEPPQIEATGAAARTSQETRTDGTPVALATSTNLRPPTPPSPLDQAAPGTLVVSKSEEPTPTLPPEARGTQGQAAHWQPEVVAPSTTATSSGGSAPTGMPTLLSSQAQHASISAPPATYAGSGLDSRPAQLGTETGDSAK